MEFFHLDSGDDPAAVNISRFQGRSGVGEVHLVVRPTLLDSIDVQLAWVLRAYREALESVGLDTSTAVLRRFFCSDLVNQAHVLRAHPLSDPASTSEPCAVSLIGQPPSFPARVALWAYHVCDPDRELHKTRDDGSLTLQRGELSHLWTTGMTCSGADTAHGQARGILDEYDAFLRARSLTVSDHLIRTWLFVRDIDTNYRGLVDARREFFARRGLTPGTHYVASSGIEGVSEDVAAIIAMDAYAISGVRPEQIEFIRALNHLSPTHVYGVTFERAMAVSYRDRKHVVISGTASIDRDGNMLHPGDVTMQLERTLVNVQALLEQAGATLDDMSVFIAYVRNESDHATVHHQLRERFGDAPIEVVVASVCRPGWLVEVEGMAIVPASNPGLPAF